MGSAWGLNDSGKDSAGWPREMGEWSEEQMRQWLERQNRFGNLGEWYAGDAGDYWGGRRADGIGSVEDAAGTGEAISPWMRDYIANQRGRRGAIRGREEGRRTADDYQNELSSRLDEMGVGIGNAYTDMEGEINDTARRAFERDEAASRDVVGNWQGTANSQTGAVNDTWGGLRGRNASVYGGLRGDNASTYAGIKGSGKESFGRQAKNLSLIRPGGTAQQGRVARSFAGQTADTMARLRRAGIDPNSPEAASLLRGVETSRSRAMDDAAAASTDSYVRSANDLENNQLGFTTAAERARLENEIGLGTREFGNEADLATGQTDRTNRIGDTATTRVNAEMLRSAGTRSAIDRDRSDRTGTNLNTSFERGQNLARDRNDLTLWGRNAGMQDVDRMNQVDAGDDEAELQAGGLEDTRFQRGLQFRGMDQAARDTAAREMGSIGRDWTNNQFRAGQMAGQWGNQATQAHQTNLAMQAPKAGWGSRLLGGIAQAGLSLIPGGGMAANLARGLGGAVIGGVTGAPAVQRPQGGWGGGFGTPPFNPNAGSYYDPSRTTTLPNGDVQVFPRSVGRNSRGWGQRAA